LPILALISPIYQKSLRKGFVNIPFALREKVAVGRMRERALQQEKLALHGLF
jgi:hypothetical protein